ncbi:uncharacterized protein CBL_06560 [Carabus blaptoides fortunei]
MQSNGNVVQTSDTKANRLSDTSPAAKNKPIPPKPPKRVSFDLKYRQITPKSRSFTFTAGKTSVIGSVQRSEKISVINGDIVNANIRVGTNVSTVDIEQPSVNTLRKSSDETKGNIDKLCDNTPSSQQTNTDICDTGQTKADNAVPITVEVAKISTTDRLRSEFVKSNENPTKAYVWPGKSTETRSLISSPKSPSGDAQSRLSESQSKIAKLQQSLPTKLSDATVESLKNKYSPASFGYPKSFIKSQSEASKIPSLIGKSSTDTSLKESNKSTVSTKDKQNELDIPVSRNTQVKTEESSSPGKGAIVTVERRRTFRTELFILPTETDLVKNKEENNNYEKSVNYTDKIANQDTDSKAVKRKEELEVKANTVQAKFISSEIFPKELVEPVSDKSTSEENPVIENIIVDDPSEQSSDTLTESEDSQILNSSAPVQVPEQYSDILKDADDDSASITPTDDCETGSYTSEISYCEVYEDLQEPEMEDLKKKPQKKRSNSFRRIFSFGSSKDKKKNEDAKNEKTKSNSNGKKKDHMLSDNAQNEAHVFDRNASQRHTVSGQYNSRDWERRNANLKENIPCEPHYSNATDRPQGQKLDDQYTSSNYENNRMVSNLPIPPPRQPSTTKDCQENMIDDRLNQMQYDMYLSQKTNQQLNSNLIGKQQQRNIDEYVCMTSSDMVNRTDLTQPGFINAHSIDKYIDTTSSSSISTLESDTRNIIYENAIKTNKTIQKVQNSENIKSPPPNNFDRNIGKDSSPASGIGEKCYERPKFADSPEIFTTAPKRVQGPQLIKPKAIIPINTERPLPNPYRTLRDGQQLKSPLPSNPENFYGNIPIPIENPRTGKGIIADISGHYVNKDTVYGKPIVAQRNESTYGNIQKKEEEVYGVVYDSLIPVGAQLKITKPPIINSGKQMEKRSRSVSPSRRHKAVTLSSSQSFRQKPKSPPAQMSPSSPNRKELEATKLKLPANREKSEPRLKSPVEDRRSLGKKTPEPTKKIVELTKKESVNIVPSHQKLEIEINYPDNNINEAQDRKETPEKFMFSSNESDNNQINHQLSPSRTTNIKRSKPVSSNRPKSFTHSTPKGHGGDTLLSDASYSEIPRMAVLKSPVLNRTGSPVSIISSQSMSSISSKTKLPIPSEDLKDLKNTEVYFWEQTSQQEKQMAKKEDMSPDQSPQQLLTHVTVHQPKSSPRKSDPPLSTNSLLAPTEQPQQKPPTSPQKVQNLQNVEAYYWQQIKKLKEKEEHEIYNQQLQLMARQNAMNIPPELINQQRSRSMIVGSRAGQKRSMSLPRDSMSPANQRINNDLYGYARTGRHESIPEGRALVDPRISAERLQQYAEYGILRQNIPMQNNNFVRGIPQRSTVGPIHMKKQAHTTDSIYENYFPGVELRNQARSVNANSGYAPIFKRGSLVSGQNSTQQDSPPQGNKKVSFSSAQSDEGQVWPTKNGFTQSPPTRRVDKRAESLDDEVFLMSNTDNLKNMQIQQDPRNQMFVNYNITKDPIYVPTKLSETQPGSKDPLYATKSGQREPIYGRTSAGKQVTVNNKVCDFYGQIHESGNTQPKIYGNIQKTGVIYGQLQQNPVPGSPLSLRNQCLNRSDPTFVRGSRLTVSFNDMRTDAPRRPLPPVPDPDLPQQNLHGHLNPHVSESESGSEAGEVQRFMWQERRRLAEEEWNSDSKSGRSQSGGDSGVGGGRGGGDNDNEVRGSRSARSGRRDDPRRHTLSGADQHYPSGMSVQQGGPLSRTMDLEVPMPRGYPPPSSAMLFDDDPGIMSEVETSSTGFRRGGKQRSSLPVVRTPSKTLERPLGLVFLQYRNETKRALLPNEITSIDTVKALFVRSFPKQLTMEYLDSPLVKIYIHDSSKDMFYELEDLRSHLRDIRDRSVLRLFESADISGGLPGPGTGISGGVGHFEDQSYFSEPEFDSEYQHQHIHKSKVSERIFSKCLRLLARNLK